MSNKYTETIELIHLVKGPHGTGKGVVIIALTIVLLFKIISMINIMYTRRLKLEVRNHFRGIRWKGPKKRMKEKRQGERHV